MYATEVRVIQKLSVLMPVYNEARTLQTIVAQVLASPVDADIELICVDDCSTDESLAILGKLADNDSRITVVSQAVNRGKGKAIRTAIEHMTGDIAIIQDADLEYDPNEYPIVLQPILDGRADVVYGSRFAASPERRVLFYWHSLGNRFLTALSNMANDLNLTDMETCYKAFRAEVLKNMRLTSDRFGIEPEIAARLSRVGAKIYEVPISYHGRTYAEGKNIGWRDGVQALWLIFKFRFIDTRASIDSGHATLESLAGSPKVAQWTVEQFEGLLGDRVLEAGCGMGNLTGHLTGGDHLTVIDIDEAHIDSVRDKFGHLQNFESTQGDLQDPSTFAGMEDKFDSVVCINVLEHIVDPEAAVSHFHKVLRSGGRALVLVPAHQWLYSAADKALGHTMRYEAGSLSTLLESSGLVVERVGYFNRLGVLGWLTNKVMGRTDISPLQAKMFGWLLPFARLVERLTFLPGLSVVAVASKP
jgi:SAM-dependent methyltransferase